MRMTNPATYLGICCLCFVLFGRECAATDDDLSGSLRVLPDDLESSETVRRSFVAMLSSSPSPVSTSSRVRQMFLDLNDLAFSKRIQQLEGWVLIRENIGMDSVKTTVLGESLSLLIADSIIAWLDDYTRLVGKGAASSVRAEELLKSLAEINRRNAVASAENIDAILAAAPKTESNDLDLVRLELVKQIDGESERAYVKRFGKNVIALQNAGNKPTFARGFQACIDRLPKSYSVLEDEPNGLNAMAYFLAVEHYVFASSQHAQQSLSELLGGSHKIAVKGSAFPHDAPSHAKIRAQVSTYNECKGGIWNRLLLKDDRWNE